MKTLEHAAESLAAVDLTIRLANVIDGVDEFVVEPLVVVLGVVVFQVRS